MPTLLSTCPEDSPIENRFLPKPCLASKVYKAYCDPPMLFSNPLVSSSCNAPELMSPIVPALVVKIAAVYLHAHLLFHSPLNPHH